ncbi:MAG: DUF3820 family protein [Sulfurimonas sp.]|jgi:uncharacterized HAD superfamily protein
MNKAQLIFTKNQDSFNVVVQNLEQLSVEEIQKIEHFVTARKGIFYFNTYSFFIPKKINFDEFILLLKHVEIDAVCEEEVLKVISQKKINFGQYKGMLYSELPDSYLVWLKSSYRGAEREIIDAELKQRNL